MYKNKIHIYNHDIRSFLKSYIPQYIDRAFIYFDPPYYNKGKCLYKNFFIDKDHKDIHDLIIDLECPWIVTYDNATKIREIYHEMNFWKFDLTYGVANNGKNSELLFISDENLLPNNTSKTAIKINLRHCNS